MTYRVRFASVSFAALLAPVLLGGCAEMENDQRLVTYAAWKQMDEPARPRVEEVPVRHVVHFLPGADIMTASDRVTLAGFLASNGIDRGSQVALSVVSPTVDGVARQASRLQAVAAALNQMGVATIAQPPTVEPAADLAGAQRDDIAVVGYSLAVLPADCPGYTTPVQLDNSGRPITSWGCSNAANLGLMVADPRDLVEGRTFGPGDGEKGALGIRKYREGGNATVTTESTTTSSGG